MQPFTVHGKPKKQTGTIFSIFVIEIPLPAGTIDIFIPCNGTLTYNLYVTTPDLKTGMLETFNYELVTFSKQTHYEERFCRFLLRLVKNSIF